MNLLPSLFLGHGAPDLPLSQLPARQFLTGLAARFSKPSAIVIVSAHWQETVTTIGSSPNPETIYDFGGWPRALYEINYPARTDAGVIQRIGQCLDAADIENRTNPTRGYDHGVWVPLLLAFGAADIPVVQISLTLNQSAEYHLRLGQALARLRAEGVLIIGSGATVHNLRRVSPEGTSPPQWAVAFENWLHNAIMAGNLKELLSFPGQPDLALKAHPTPEHLMPLFVSLGASLPGSTAKRLHQSFSYGSIGMACYAFESFEGTQGR